MPAAKELQWKVEEDALIKRSSLNGLSFKQIQQLLPHRTLKAVVCRVYALNLRSNNPRQKYVKNENFWETPNAINSYYAGLAAADMSIEKRHGYCLSWQCHSDDEQYMIEFIKRSEFTGKPFRIKEKSPKSESVNVHSCLRVCSCAKWAQDLEKNFCVIPSKTRRLCPPNLSSDFLKCCYIIGYTDGDGCLCKTTNDRISISYTSASKDIIAWIRCFIDEKFNFAARKKKKNISVSSNGAYYGCAINGIQAVKVFELLRQIDVPKFSRKWNNSDFLNAVDIYHEKFPFFFAQNGKQSFDIYGNIVNQ